MKTSTIIYFKHGLGNLIMMTPAMRALASMDKSGKIDVCMDSEWNDNRRPAFNDLINGLDFVNKIVNYPKENLQNGYKRWFYTGHAEISEAFPIFKKKCPLGAAAPDWKLNSMHEVLWYMDVVYRMGYKGAIPKQQVPVAEKPILNGRALRIGICNGCYSWRMKTGKTWPYFQELVKVLKNYYDANIIKIGYQEELKGVDCDVDYINKLTFSESAKVISQLDLFITTDTANMHVGDALGIPMVVIFGGTLVSKNAPLSKNAEIVKLNLPCQPCQRTNSFYHCEHYNCLAKLTVGDVMAVVRRKLWQK